MDAAANSGATSCSSKGGAHGKYWKSTLHWSVAWVVCACVCVCLSVCLSVCLPV